MNRRWRRGTRVDYDGVIRPRHQVRIWSIFSREDRLVLALSDEPGEFNFARVPDEDSDPVLCPFATLQCYDSKVEAEILNLVFRSSDLEDFIDRIATRGYRILEGRPQPRKFARL